jgi:VanZ family protein
MRTSEIDHSPTATSSARRLLSRLLSWGPAVAIVALIFRLSNDSDLGGPGWVTALAYRLTGDWPGIARFEPLLSIADDYLSWGAHFVFYGALALALLWALRREWPRLAHAAWMAWSLTVLYGLSDELHQSFVPGRKEDWRDIVTDAAGAAVALGIVWLLRWWKRNKVKG